MMRIFFIFVFIMWLIFWSILGDCIVLDNASLKCFLGLFIMGNAIFEGILIIFA